MTPVVDENYLTAMPESADPDDLCEAVADRIE
jgi:hypothetical protein